MSDSVYTPEEGAAIATFIDQLPDICAETLSRGVRSGDEWIVGDLQNSKGKSCHVNIKKGCFFDHNPAADPQKGGAIVLFGELFGHGSYDEITILEKMVEWSRGYEAPEFRTEKKKKNSLDEQEEQWIRAIEGHKEDIAYAQAHPEAAYYGPEDYLRELNIRLANATAGLEKVRQQKQAIQAEQAQRKAEERKREKAETEKWSCFWAGLSASTIQLKDDLARHLAKYRGLSEEVFLWLIENGYIALDGNLQIAFPIVKRDGVVGLHVKWINDDDGTSGWYCTPPGTKLSPFIIGDPATSDLVVITESTWDAIAYFDLYELYKEEGCCAIATRGAINAARIPKNKIDREATIILVLQNDEANRQWLAHLPFIVRKRGHLVVPPEDVKDLNDWMRAESKPEIIRQLTE
jgi:hypothetical protein